MREAKSDWKSFDADKIVVVLESTTQSDWSGEVLAAEDNSAKAGLIYSSARGLIFG